MKTFKTIILTFTLAVAAVGLMACGNDENADEGTSVETTMETITNNDDVLDEVTSDREIVETKIEETKKDKDDDKNDGVVGDIVDDAETKMDEIESDMKE